MVTITKQDVEKIYDELDRRIQLDIEDGTIPNKDKWIWDERASRLQGVYGTMMAIVSNENWQKIVWWKDDIEEERYGERVWS